MSVVDPETDPDDAAMVVVPTELATADPMAFICATAGVLDVHDALAVMSTILPSVNVPDAVNCCVNPTARVGSAGVTANDCNPLTNDTFAIFVAPLIK